MSFQPDACSQLGHVERAADVRPPASRIDRCFRSESSLRCDDAERAISADVVDRRVLKRHDARLFCGFPQRVIHYKSRNTVCLRFDLDLTHTFGEEDARARDADGSKWPLMVLSEKSI